MTKFLRCTLAVATISFLPANATADSLSVAFVQDKTALSSQLGLAPSYQIVAAELERTLLLQNVVVLNVEAAKPVSGSYFLNERFAGQDYGIIYSISPLISQNRVARTLTVSASGQIYDPRSGRLVASFEVNAPETVPLPNDDAACNKACVANEIAKVSNDLARELSFVLTQKLHFLREDQGQVNTADSAAIAQRLNGSKNQPLRIETIETQAGQYQIDKGRALDVEVFFDFGSAELGAKAKSQLMPLGQALASDLLSGSRYLVVGHTDAKGSADYNRKLSNQRAKAVREYLLQAYTIAPDRLIAVGLGEDHLRSPEEPNAAINRRVEIAAIVSPPPLLPPIAGAHDYTLTFSLLPRDAILQVVRQLEASSLDAVELLKSSTTQRVYSARTGLALIEFEEQLMMALMDQDIDLDQLRISTTTTSITVEKIK
ncbi:OmpA family protein [Pseudophaeobacter sp. TrK17]|uniref:OmpA family protein n=1 Tax=Pseudophaeobacter sp. TrK17 TaxID=2815167 RepID=UPI0035D0E25C